MGFFLQHFNVHGGKAHCIYEYTRSLGPLRGPTSSEYICLNLDLRTTLSTRKLISQPDIFPKISKFCYPWDFAEVLQASSTHRDCGLIGWSATV